MEGEGGGEGGEEEEGEGGEIEGLVLVADLSKEDISANSSKTILLLFFKF